MIQGDDDAPQIPILHNRLGKVHVVFNYHKGAVYRGGGTKWWVVVVELFYPPYGHLGSGCDSLQAGAWAHDCITSRTATEASPRAWTTMPLLQSPPSTPCPSCIDTPVAVFHPSHNVIRKLSSRDVLDDTCPGTVQMIPLLLLSSSF